jgi:hypothetical protein
MARSADAAPLLPHISEMKKALGKKGGRHKGQPTPVQK